MYGVCVSGDRKEIGGVNEGSDSVTWVEAMPRLRFIFGPTEGYKGVKEGRGVGC